MTWIYEYPDWPAFRWDDSALAASLAAVRHQQGRLLGRMESLGFDLRREASLSTLTDDVLTSSAIEGELLDSKEVRSSIARRLGIDIGGLVPTPRRVEGVVEMMLDATQNHGDALTAARLCGWHAALFPTGHSGMHQITVGAWRTEAAGTMRVVSGPLGHEQVHFVAPPAARLDAYMDDFLGWFEGTGDIDPVLKAALAHLWFVTIHPFEDGNGRIGRAVADMALARADGSRDRFYSLSAQIEMRRKHYYLQLERQQRSDLDATEWIDWFLECLRGAFTSADGVLRAVLYKAQLWQKVNRGGVNQRQRQVLTRMLDEFQGYLNTSKYAKLGKCSTDTALRDIRDLLDRGVLVQNPGRGRSTSYRLPTSEELKNASS